MWSQQSCLTGWLLCTAFTLHIQHQGHALSAFWHMGYLSLPFPEARSYAGSRSTRTLLSSGSTLQVSFEHSLAFACSPF